MNESPIRSSHLVTDDKVSRSQRLYLRAKSFLSTAKSTASRFVRRGRGKQQTDNWTRPERGVSVRPGSEHYERLEIKELVFPDMDEWAEVATNALSTAYREHGGVIPSPSASRVWPLEWAVYVSQYIEPETSPCNVLHTRT
jgi:hypothetical protein